MADNGSKNDLRIAISPSSRPSTGALAPSRDLVAPWFIQELVAKASKREKIARSLVANPDGTTQSGEEFLTEMRARRDE